MSFLAPLAPGVFLALLLGTFHGSVAHLLLGRHWLRLPLFIMIGIGACVLVWLSNIHLLRQLPAPGGLPLVEASLLAWLLLVGVAVWLRK